MGIKEDIHEYLLEHPHSTKREIFTALELKEGTASGILYQHKDKLFLAYTGYQETKWSAIGGETKKQKAKKRPVNWLHPKIHPIPNGPVCHA